MNVFKRSKLTHGEIGWGGGVKKKLKKENRQLLHGGAKLFPVYFKAWRPTPRFTL